jgi:alkylation response protein AidB-like acyl-CoA dehydrogenase
MSQQTYPTGGEFLLRAAAPAEVFTPEDFDENQRMIAQAARDFIQQKIDPRREQIEYQGDTALGGPLLKEAGAMGLLAVDVPERFGGMGADKATVMIISELISRSGSFAVQHGAQAGIGTLPIVYFGTETQKAQYLPRLATGELLTAYALTEPGSGSDALAARTTATLNPAGTHYLLNGVKQYISNAGFADLFIVFAKIDGDKFTAFIVEKSFGGVVIGAEEKKMGIRGSSTCQVILEDCPVPVANVLGEVGKGHHIAFNILNVGRFKLGASTVGGCKLALEWSVPYTTQREQFGAPLSSFGLIRAKIGDVVAAAFAAESMVYRTAGLLDGAIATLDKGAADYDLKSILKVEEFSIECSMIKIFATEAMALAAEEGVQMLGGYGYCQEYGLERLYRDERINRIFEGTNEINRLLVPGLLLRKALKGELPLLQAAQKIAEELMGVPEFAAPGEPGFLEQETKLVANLKKTALAALGIAARTFGDKLKDQQEVLADCADLVIAAYACESALLRTQKQAARAGADGAGVAVMADLTALCVNDAMERAAVLGRRALANTLAGDELRTMLAGLRRLTKHDPAPRAQLHDRIAAAAIAAGGYPF